MSRSFKKVVAVLSAIAMIVTGITIQPKAVKADAPDWSSIEWIGDGAGGGKYANTYKFYSENGKVVNIQKPGFASEDSIYATFSAGITAASVESDIQGAGICLHLSQFTQKVTEFTVSVAGVGDVVCYVYNEKGTEGETTTADPAAPTTTPAPTTTEAPTEKKPVVSVDGTEVAVENGKVTLGDAEYGYYANGKMYKPGTEVEVTEDMAFTSVNTLSVARQNGAGIRYKGTAGIRFQATVASDNMAAVSSDAITEGMLITAKDLYEANGAALDLTSGYTTINVKNSGWYNGTEGTFCASICNIVESNYIRNFVAKAYVTITYTDGTATTVYSNVPEAR